MASTQQSRGAHHPAPSEQAESEGTDPTGCSQWAAGSRERQLWLQMTRAALLWLRGQLASLARALPALDARRDTQHNPSAAARIPFPPDPPVPGKGSQSGWGNAGKDTAVSAAGGGISGQNRENLF